MVTIKKLKIISISQQTIEISWLVNFITKEMNKRDFLPEIYR